MTLMKIVGSISSGQVGETQRRRFLPKLPSLSENENSL